MTEAAKFPKDWAGITGDWVLDKNVARYVGSENPHPHGILIGSDRIGGGIGAGTVKTTITLSQDAVSGQILLSYNGQNSRYVTAGLGGNDEAYTISEHVPGIGWNWVERAGKRSYLEAERTYQVEVRLDGYRINLSVDRVPVLTHILSQPLEQGQVGIFATGRCGAVEFGPVETTTQAPAAFVVMQFTPQFDALYEDVVQPVCANMGIEAYRASDIYRPGVIIQDIIQGLAESQVIIAEITPANPNVFYELGYSHALRKPAVLLADRGTVLPFDISGHRVIFYDNTIGGKNRLEAELRQHLSNILANKSRIPGG